MSDNEVSGDEEDYEVEGIVGHKDSRNGRKYEVKWKGYKETTFEPRENLVPNSEHLVVKYNKKHPMKKSKSRKRLKPKDEQDGNTGKSDVSSILDSQSENVGADSSNENKKPRAEAKQKRKFSERVKSRGKSHKKNRTKESARSTKVVRASTLRNSKRGRNRGSSRRMLLKSSSESSPEEYEVQLLLRHRDLEEGRMYLVKWKGYPKSEATWEPSSNLSCRTLVRQYDHCRGKWKRPRKRASLSSDKQPSKRIRLSQRSDNSDLEAKEGVVKKPARGRLLKRKDGTWSKEREDVKTGKQDGADHANEDEKQAIAGDKEEKFEDKPKSEKHKEVAKADKDVDIAGEEKSEEKGVTKDKVKKELDSEKGSVGESGKTKDKSPQGKQDKSLQGKKPQEDVGQKQVEDKKSE